MAAFMSCLARLDPDRLFDPNWLSFELFMDVISFLFSGWCVWVDWR